MKYFPTAAICILLIFVISLNEKTTSSYFCEKIILWKKLNFINGFVSEMCNQYLSFLSIIICILYHSILYFVRLTICLACKEQTFWIIDLVLDNYLTITWQLLDNYLTITRQSLENYSTITYLNLTILKTYRDCDFYSIRLMDRLLYVLSNEIYSFLYCILFLFMFGIIVKHRNISF